MRETETNKQKRFKWESRMLAHDFNLTGRRRQVDLYEYEASVVNTEFQNSSKQTNKNKSLSGFSDDWVNGFQLEL